MVDFYTGGVGEGGGVVVVGGEGGGGGGEGGGCGGGEGDGGGTMTFTVLRESCTLHTFTILRQNALTFTLPPPYGLLHGELLYTWRGSRFKKITKRQERETDRQRSYNAQLDRTGLPPAGYETALRTVFAIALNTKARPTGARYGGVHGI